MYTKTIFKTLILECYIKPMARPKSHIHRSNEIDNVSCMHSQNATDLMQIVDSTGLILKARLVQYITGNVLLLEVLKYFLNGIF